MTLEDLIAERVAAVVSSAFDAKLAEITEERSPRLLDRQGLAAALACSVDVVDRLRREGLPMIKVGDSPRFDLTDCLAWLKTRPTSGVVARKAG